MIHVLKGLQAAIGRYRVDIFVGEPNHSLKDWVNSMSSEELLKLEGIINKKMCERFNDEAKKEEVRFEVHIDL